MRELENVLGNACLMAEGDVIDIADLPEHLRERPVSADGSPLLSLDEMDRRYVRQVVERLQGNKARAAEVLGISKNTLYKLLSNPSGAIVADT